MREEVKVRKGKNVHVRKPGIKRKWKSAWSSAKAVEYINEKL